MKALKKAINIFQPTQIRLDQIDFLSRSNSSYSNLISFSPNDRAEQLAVVRNMKADCIRDIRFWMLNNDLKFNDGKTEFLIIGSSQQLEKLHNLTIRVGDSDIYPVGHSREILVVGLILGCPQHHTSQKSVSLHFTIFIIFVGSESIFHGSQLRYLSMHS